MDSKCVVKLFFEELFTFKARNTALIEQLVQLSKQTKRNGNPKGWISDRLLEIAASSFEDSTILSNQEALECWKSISENIIYTLENEITRDDHASAINPQGNVPVDEEIGSPRSPQKVTKRKVIQFLQNLQAKKDANGFLNATNIEKSKPVKVNPPSTLKRLKKKPATRGILPAIKKPKYSLPEGLTITPLPGSSKAYISNENATQKITDISGKATAGTSATFINNEKVVGDDEAMEVETTRFNPAPHANNPPVILIESDDETSISTEIDHEGKLNGPQTSIQECQTLKLGESESTEKSCVSLSQEVQTDSTFASTSVGCQNGSLNPSFNIVAINPKISQILASLLECSQNDTGVSKESTAHTSALLINQQTMPVSTFPLVTTENVPLNDSVLPNLFSVNISIPQANTQESPSFTSTHHGNPLGLNNNPLTFSTINFPDLENMDIDLSKINLDVFTPTDMETPPGQLFSQ